jgi:subtilase family serine protease
MLRSEMFEPLEPRRLLSVSYTPAQIETAYGFNNIIFPGCVIGTGAGQTIALVEVDNDTTLSSDLTTFDSTFHIPAPPSLGIIGKYGGAPPSSTVVGTEGFETALDVEWAHALAPAANILVVEANSGANDDLLAAETEAGSVSGVSVVSMSYTRPEIPYDSATDDVFTNPGITYVSAAGDVGETMHPAASPNVVGVGGTSLTLNLDNTYNSETVWGSTGGGPSSVFSEPAYQEGVQNSGVRETPDVAFDADPNTGLDVNYDGLFYAVGGTSAGAPAWAALFAIADQGRALNQLDPLTGGTETLPMLYALANTPYYSQAFNDITSGSNGDYSAGPGYDEVTGLGSPKAQFLANYLAGNGVPEPATAAIALSAAVLLFKRRRTPLNNSAAQR